MSSILKVKRVKINKNLQTVYNYKTYTRIDLDAEYPLSWENYEFKDNDFTKIYLSSGRIILIDMKVDEWDKFYLEAKQLYELENKELPPIIPN